MYVLVCGYVYDEAKVFQKRELNLVLHGNDLPENWVCPHCGATKGEFEVQGAPEYIQKTRTVLEAPTDMKEMTALEVKCSLL